MATNFETNQAPPAANPSSLDLTARVLYRDALVLVIDKPAGWAVHPGPGRHPNLQPLYSQLRFGLPRDPALAHRLDRETSGCLVLGRHAKPLRQLGQLFKANKITKTYYAIAVGVPPAAAGQIDAPLLQVKTGGAFGYFMKVDATGQEALTDYRVVAATAHHSFLELQPRTGRTHQLRAHAAHLGCPLVGDTRYGGPAHASGIMLHAAQIVLPLSKNKPPVVVDAPMPAAFVATLAQLDLQKPTEVGA